MMATTERDYYDVLGVPRTASQDDIKKAYRRLARQYHPDLHTGPRKVSMEQKFKELNAAHEVLGDPETRKKYDRYGHNWREAEAYERARREAGAGMGEGPGFYTAGEGQDFGDLFNMFFGREGSGSGASFRGFGMAGTDLESTIRLSLREVLTGTTRRLQLTEPITCHMCGGSGRQGGRRCTACGGTGAREEVRTIDVKIPAGVQDGSRVRVPGKGAHGGRGGKHGDLYLRIQIEPDRVFRRRDNDLQVTLPVFPWEAALGVEVLAPTLTDTIRVKVPPGSRSGGKLRIKGRGLPTEAGARGDLYYILQIVLPSSLSDEERKLYQQLARLSHADPRMELLREARHG
jgi:DnaJ-class molecular chaperone